MQIELLYFDDCPNWQSTLVEIQSVLAEMGRDDTVGMVRVADQPQAERLRFPGSPTVRIDGRDVEDDAPDSGFGLECRIYWEQGRATGSPSRDLLVSALRDAVD